MLSTAGSREEAEGLARALVEKRLAACVNLLPGLTSVYRWRDELETADEVLLIIKTTAERLEDLEATLRGLHSYEVPEFLVMSPESGSPLYLEWLGQSVAGSAALDEEN